MEANKFYHVETEVTYKGFPLVVIFVADGHRCGYVGIPKGHKVYGIDFFGDPILSELIVHGGLSYAGQQEGYPIDMKNVWWVGFDCNHICDAPDPEMIVKYQLTITPAHFEDRKERALAYGTHKSNKYCVTQCERLIDQIIEAFGVPNE